MPTPLFLGATCAALLSFAPAPAGDDTLVARAGDLELTREAYEDWLLLRYGVDSAHTFVTESLVLREAEQRGLLPSEAEIAAAYGAEAADQARLFFHGDRHAREADLAQRGFSPAGHRLFRCDQMRFELALEKIARADRPVGEPDLRRRFAEIYGDPPERTELEVLFFSMNAPASQPGVTPERGAKDIARERAAAARAALEAGRPLAEVAAGSDPIDNAFVADHHVAAYRSNLFGPHVDRAIATLDVPGAIAGPVEVWDGYWVVQLEGRAAVTYEQVMADLEREVLDAPLDSGVLTQVQVRVLRESAAEILIGQEQEP